MSKDWNNNICRPGGMELTAYAVGLAGITPGARILDVGCGRGATVSYLRGEGFDAAGVDIDDVAIRDAGERCSCADALALPYSGAYFEGVLFECSLSAVGETGLALLEAGRVLRPGGVLVVSDLYARAQSGAQGLYSRQVWLRLFAGCGYIALHFEDRTEDLKALAAQMLWRGEELPYIGRSRAPCGYFLFIGKK